MRQQLKDGLRSLAASTGYDIRHATVYTSARLRQQSLFSLLHIDLVIDVGANTGQFARQCRTHGYQGEIISFEPTSAAHANLLQSAVSDPLWTVAQRMALGADTDEAEINIAANSFSSSLLPMLDSHLSAAPHSAYFQKEKVPLRRLDDVLATTFPNRKIFLKLDVQGYESQVLAGASQLLSQTAALQLEMSLLPLYEGEVLMPEMTAEMFARDFHLWDLDPSFRDQTTGRLLQVDAIFVRHPMNA